MVTCIVDGSYSRIVAHHVPPMLGVMVVVLPWQRVVSAGLGNNGFAVDDDGYFVAFKTTYLTGEFGERSFWICGYLRSNEGVIILNWSLVPEALA